jgi:hypothetical protein
VSARTPPDFAAAVEARYPGLIAAARAVIERSEREFAGAGKGAKSYLWEHTSHVAALSYRLALAEGCAPSMLRQRGRALRPRRLRQPGCTRQLLQPD